MPALIEDLAWRNLVANVSDEAAVGELLDGEPTAIYAGFDPTAESLHIGNLQVICLLARFNNAGHVPIALAGGGTGLIGDPSGRASERTLKATAEVESLTARIEGQLGAILGRVTHAESPDPVFANNLAWIGELSAIELLRDVGKHFSVNTMIAKDSVSVRLEAGEQGLSFTEFSYMLLQAYDFGMLYDRHGCRMQVGGNDQWGNITVGLDYLRRTGRPGAFGLTSPLILRSDGQKFGKSVDGAVWLDRTRTSPFALYQYFLNIPDSDVVDMLKRLTFLDRDTISDLDDAVHSRPHERAAQRRLAEELTAIAHGPDAVDEAVKISEWIFGGEPRPAELGGDMGSPLAGFEIRAQPLDADLTWEQVAVNAGLAESLGAGRRLIRGGGVYVDGRRLEAEGPVDAALLPSDGLVVIRKGKKTPSVIIFE